MSQRSEIVEYNMCMYNTDYVIGQKHSYYFERCRLSQNSSNNNKKFTELQRWMSMSNQINEIRM